MRRETPPSGIPFTLDRSDDPESFEVHKARNIVGGAEGVFAGETAEGRYVVYCMTGVARKTNQDSVGTIPGRGVYILADGMGGHKGGEVASTIAVEQIEAGVRDGVDIHDPWLLDRVRMTGGMRTSEDEKLDDMGTTVCVFEVKGNKLKVTHAGDSRIRIYGKDGKLKYISMDHSYLQAEMTEISMKLGKAKHNDSETILKLLEVDSDSARAHYIYNAIRPRKGKTSFSKDVDDGFRPDNKLVKINDVGDLSPNGRIMIPQPEMVTEVDLSSGDIVISSTDGLDQKEEDLELAIRAAGGNIKKLAELLQVGPGASGMDNTSFHIYQQK